MSDFYTSFEYVLPDEERIEVCLIRAMSKPLREYLIRAIKKEEKFAEAIDHIYKNAKAVDPQIRGVEIEMSFEDFNKTAKATIRPLTTKMNVLRSYEEIYVALPEHVIKPPIPKWCHHFGYEGWCDSMWYFTFEVKAEIYKFMDLLMTLYERIREEEVLK